MREKSIIQGAMMAIVRVDDSFRIVIDKATREAIQLKKHQEVLLVPEGARIILFPLPDKPNVELAKLLQGITFDRNAREKATKWLQEQKH